MTFAVVYRRAASDDIDEAIRWLGERSPAAAVDFLRAIARAETHLRRTPLIYQVVRADIRRAHLKPISIRAVLSRCRRSRAGGRLSSRQPVTHRDRQCVGRAPLEA